MECKSCQWWNVVYFGRYLDEKIGPKGMQMQIFLNVINVTTAFKEHWKAHSDTYTCYMITYMEEY